ncbi:ANTAR domain-containing protein [Streptomyces sp. G45]|uniref:ANTAR domain-containing protein n=1 Tax=Streptomyces sp. G45 TaxID=3406627 RepID=UPI003C284BB4
MVSGDLDLDTDQQLRRELRSALARANRGIDLDLSGVAFCDCSGLNTLLHIRQRALRASKTATISAISPAAERVFVHADALPLFAADGDARPADAHKDEEELRVEVAQLRRALQTRGPIDTARGILMAVFALSQEEAWNVLVMTSQNTNTKLHLTAQQLVDSVKGEPLPEASQEQLSAAVAHVTAAQN